MTGQKLVILEKKLIVPFMIKFYNFGSEIKYIKQYELCCDWKF